MMRRADSGSSRTPLPSWLLLMAAVAAGMTGAVLSGGFGLGGYEESARRVLDSEWWGLWVLPPIEFALFALIAQRGALAIAARPARMRRRARLALSAGVAILVAAVASPVAVLAQGGLLGAHMMQHVLLGAFAPPLILAAWPLRAPDQPRHLAIGLRRLLHPLPALALWVASTLIWLWPPLHHLILVNTALWIVQQVAFFLCGVVLWAPVLERFAAVPSWFGAGAKSIYITVVWAVGLTIANAYWFAGGSFYVSHAAAAKAWGMSPLQDQANAGTVMMSTHCVLAIGAMGVLFFRQARHDAIVQRLVDGGVDPVEARHIVRCGDPVERACRAGFSLTVRPGID